MSERGAVREKAGRGRSPRWLVICLAIALVMGGAMAIAVMTNVASLGDQRELGGADCRPRRLVETIACRGQDSSFNECRYYLRATGTPDEAWCRAMLEAAGHPESSAPCDLDSPKSWAEVDCQRYSLASYDRCFICSVGEREAYRTYLYGYDRKCTRAVEQVTCNFDPAEAGRRLSR